MTDADTAQPRDRGLRRIFIGNDGLRAGWSLLLFCLILTVLTIGAVAAATFINGKPPHPPSGAPQGVIPSIKGEALTFAVLLVTFAAGALGQALRGRRGAPSFSRVLSGV